MRSKSSCRYLSDSITIAFLLGVVFISNYWFILNHFFVGGGYLLDSGWFAGLVYRNPLLVQPAALGPGNYFATHFSPFLQLLSLLSYCTWLPLPFYYAFTQGLIYSVVTLGGTVVLKSLFRQPLALTIVALMFAYNGVVQASIGYPHFEPVYAGWALLFMICLVYNWKSAVVFFVLTLSVREDTGLHLFGFLFPLYLVTWIETDLRPYRKRLAAFSAAAFSYSIIVIAVQKMVFQGDSALTRIYLGSPPFSHVNFQFLLDRFQLLANDAHYILVPWLLILAGAVWYRSLSFSVGFIAVLPWIVFNIFAVSDSAGTLWSYYAYPVIVSLVWPSLWFLLKRSQPRGIKAIQFLILLSSIGLFHMNHTYVLKASFSRPSVTLQDYRRLENSVNKMVLSSEIYFDSSVAALFPDKIPIHRVVHPSRDNTRSMAIVGFYNGLDTALCKTIASQNSLKIFRSFRWGNIYSVSQDKLEWPEEDWNPAWEAESRLLSIWMLKTTEFSRRTWETMVISTFASDIPRIVCYNPDLILRPGEHEITYIFSSSSPLDKGEVELTAEVLVDHSPVDIQTKTWNTVLDENKWTFTFTVPPNVGDKALECRLWSRGSAIDIVQAKLWFRGS